MVPQRDLSIVTLRSCPSTHPPKSSPPSSVQWEGSSGENTANHSSPSSSGQLWTKTSALLRTCHFGDIVMLNGQLWLKLTTYENIIRGNIRREKKDYVFWTIFITNSITDFHLVILGSSCSSANPCDGLKGTSAIHFLFNYSAVQFILGRLRHAVERIYKMYNPVIH